MTLRGLLLNPAYAGFRVYQRSEHDSPADAILRDASGEPVRAAWPPLVAPDKWWAVYRLLTNPARRTTRPGRRGTHLLSAIITCAGAGPRWCCAGHGRSGACQPATTCAGPTATLLSRSRS